jgi:hypothetical protein
MTNDQIYSENTQKEIKESKLVITERYLELAPWDK